MGLEQKWACSRLTVGAWGQYLLRDVFGVGRVRGGKKRKEDQLADLFTSLLGMQKLKHATVFLNVVRCGSDVRHRVSSGARRPIFPSKVRTVMYTV